MAKHKKLIDQIIIALSKSPNFEDIEGILVEVLDEVMEELDAAQDSERYAFLDENRELLEAAIHTIDPDDPDCANSVIDLLEQIEGI